MRMTAGSAALSPASKKLIEGEAGISNGVLVGMVFRCITNWAGPLQSFIGRSRSQV
jgi:hypothetical protein